MTEFNLDTWRLALQLNDKAKKNGESLSRNRLAKLLNVSDRIAGYIWFALQNRDIINCEAQSYDAKVGQIELAMGDLHFPFQDSAAISAMLDYAADEGVDTITINGDLLDFYQISSFSPNPVRGKRIFDEIKQARDWLAELRERFPLAEIIFKQGNHEFRLERYICDKAPQLAEMLDTLLVDKLEMTKLGIQYMTDPYRIGQLWHLHGHEKPGGSYNPEYITNVIMQYVYDHFIVFHYHRSQDKHFKRLGDRWLKGTAVGYLASSLDYAQMNKWNQGFAIIRYREDGEFEIENKSIIKGRIF